MDPHQFQAAMEPDPGLSDSSSSSNGPARPRGVKRSQAASTAGGSEVFPISIEYSKPCECCLCSAKSTDPNPLVQEPHEAEGFLPYRPWAKHRKLREHSVRVPEGKCCLPCFNVFRLLGKHRRYKTYAEYYKHISQKQNQHEHKDFLAAVKQWLKQHHDNPDKFKLQDKEELLKTQRELVISKKQGGKLTGPKKQFVLSTHWDSKRHGEWDPTKEVDHLIGGVMKKGVWRTVGQEGVYDFEAYEDTGVEERVIEDDGQQAIFADEAFQAKKQAALQTLQQQAKERDAASVKASESDMTLADLVQVVRSQSSAAASSAEVPAAAGAAGAEGKDTDSVEENSAWSSTSSEEEDTAAGLELLQSSGVKGASKETPGESSAKPAKAKAKAKAKEAPKQPSTASALPRQEKKGHASGIAKTPKATQASSLAPTSVPESNGMLSLDGRANRTLKTLEAAVSDAKQKLAEVSFDDKPQSTTQMKEFRLEVAQRISTCNTVARKAKDTVTRVGKSNNRDSFEKQLDTLQDLGNLAQASAKLLSNVIAPTLDPDAYISAHDAVSAGGVQLGPLYWLKLVVAQSQKEFLYGKYSGFCQAFALPSEPMKQLAALLGTEEAAKESALEVEHRMLACLRAIPASELALLAPGKAVPELGGEVPRMGECLDLADAIAKACDKDGQNFMARELADSVKTVRCLLGQDHVGMLVEEVKALTGLEKDKLDAAPALQKFFLQHDTGKAFLSVAQLRVEQGDNERIFEEKVEVLQKAVSHLAAWPKQSPPEAESGILAVQERIEPAVEALDAAKQTTFFQESKKKKRDQISSRLLVDLERLERQVSERSVDLVRIVCKDNMESHLTFGCNGCLDLA